MLQTLILSVCMLCVLSRRPSFLPSPPMCCICFECRLSAWTTCAVTSVRACSSEVTDTHAHTHSSETSNADERLLHHLCILSSICTNSIIWQDFFDHNIGLFMWAPFSSCRLKQKYQRNGKGKLEKAAEMQQDAFVISNYIPLIGWPIQYSEACVYIVSCCD